MAFLTKDQWSKNVSMETLVNKLAISGVEDFKNHVVTNQISCGGMVHPDSNQNLIFYACTRPNEKHAYALVQVTFSFQY